MLIRKHRLVKQTNGKTERKNKKCNHSYYGQPSCQFSPAFTVIRVPLWTQPMSKRNLRQPGDEGPDPPICRPAKLARSFRPL